MYLARAFLNPVSRAVRADLADPVSLHRTVMRAFADNSGPRAREAHGVLHRVDEDERRGRFVLLLQSTTQPDFGRFPEGYFLDLGDDLILGASSAAQNPAVRDVGEERGRIAAGDVFAFRLRANTTKKTAKLDPSGARTKNGRRVPVRGDDARLDWLSRHAAKAGFQVRKEGVVITELRAARRREPGPTFAGATFEGHLTVTDPAAFRQALEKGIGPGKAFGFGLLSIRPLR